MKLFVGLDVSLAKTAVCVLTEHGKIAREIEVSSEPEPLIAMLRGLEGTAEAIGLEAGPLSQWLHWAMTKAGLPAVLIETRQVKGALKAMPIKTDRRDAEGISRLLHLGWCRPVHCNSVSAQEERALLAARKAIPRQGTEPQACPVPGGYSHAEPWAEQRTSDMGIPCCQTPWAETRDGCPGSPHCRRVASYLG